MARHVRGPSALRQCCDRPWFRGEPLLSPLPPPSEDGYPRTNARIAGVAVTVAVEAEAVVDGKGSSGRLFSCMGGCCGTIDGCCCSCG